jgi:hypothetical protein
LILHVPSLSFVRPKFLPSTFLSNIINLAFYISFQNPCFTDVCLRVVQLYSINQKKSPFSRLIFLIFDVIYMFRNRGFIFSKTTLYTDVIYGLMFPGPCIFIYSNK